MMMVLSVITVMTSVVIPLTQRTLFHNRYSPSDNHSFENLFSVNFVSQIQVEECGENYVKECFIEYKQAAREEKIQICTDTQTRNCDADGLLKTLTKFWI